MRQANKPTLATKKLSAAEAKLSSPPIQVGAENLTPIKEENTDEDFSKLPEVQGSSDTKSLTGDGIMEPLIQRAAERLPPILHRRHPKSPGSRATGRNDILRGSNLTHERTNGRNA